MRPSRKGIEFKSHFPIREVTKFQNDTVQCQKGNLYEFYVHATREIKKSILNKNILNGNILKKKTKKNSLQLVITQKSYS